MSMDVELLQAAYDRIAESYERHGAHLRDAHERLSDELAIEPGMRCLDLGCGTGLDTLSMVQRAAPGEVVGVDCSEGMLESARRRASERGLSLTTYCTDAESFIRGCPDASFDVVTLRFMLGYLDWSTSLSKLPRLLRARGRIGLLANLASSGRQAYSTYQTMVADLGLTFVPLTMPESADQIAGGLQAGGAQPRCVWTERYRLWFANGQEVATWLRESGHASHPALEALPEPVVHSLWQTFAVRIEAHREAQGVPLDFEIAGVVADAPG